MTIQEIVKRVQEKADARFGETIERLLLTLRQRHTHSCWRKECECDYCRFINGEYVDAKLRLHKIRKRLRHLEFLHNLQFDEACQHMGLGMIEFRQKAHVRVLKEHKKELQQEIL